MRVSVIIPTHNEAQAIGRVLADLPADLVTEVLVVDSNSTDGTPEIAARMGARVLREPRRGYGRACLTGLAAAMLPTLSCFSTETTAIDLMSCRFSWRRSSKAERTSRSVRVLRSRMFVARCRGTQAFGNRLAAGLIRLLYRVRRSPISGPFRAARADVLRQLALEEDTYGWAVEMILKGALGGFRIVEVPVSYYPRIGKSKISGTLRGTVGAAWFILSLIVRYCFRRPKGMTLLSTVTAMESSDTILHSRHGDRTLVIMAKAPRPGTVKTRLAHSLPVEAVTELYRCLLDDTIGAGAFVARGEGRHHVP